AAPPGPMQGPGRPGMPASRPRDDRDWTRLRYDRLNMDLRVEELGSDTFRVEVDVGGLRTGHTVRVDPGSVARYAGGASIRRLVEESFRFLLEREPASSILPEFEVGII